MDAHRSRSLGMAALVFILISLTAAVFHGAAPVRAEDATTPTPIVIDENTATVDVRLYTDKNRTQELKDPVTSTSTLYGAFSAKFISGKAPSPGNNIAVYELPDTIVVDDAGGNLMEGTEASAAQAGTWKIEGKKVVFTFDEAWLAKTLRISMSRQTSRSSLKTRMLVLVATHLSCSLVWERSISPPRTVMSRGEVGDLLPGSRRRGQGYLDR